MTLLAMESFDGVSSVTDLNGKWSSIGTASLVTGRNGQGLQGTAPDVLQTLSAKTQLYAGIAIKIPSGTFPSFDTAAGIIGFRQSGAGGVGGMWCGVDTTGRPELMRGSSAFASGTAGVFVPDQWHYVEFYVLCQNTSGRAIMKVDELTVIDYTGDTSDGSTESFDGVRFVRGVQGSFASPGPIIDDIYVLDSSGSLNNNFLGDSLVECIRPTGDDPDSAQWSGSDGNTVDNWALVDEQARNDADYIQADGVETQYFHYGDLATLKPNIAALQIVTRAAWIGAAKNIASIARLSDDTEEASAAHSLTNAYAVYVSRRETKPPLNSGLAWTKADVNGASFGPRAL